MITSGHFEIQYGHHHICPNFIIGIRIEFLNLEIKLGYSHQNKLSSLYDPYAKVRAISVFVGINFEIRYGRQSPNDPILL